MKKARLGNLTAVLVVAMTAACATAGPIDDAITRAAGNLVADQTGPGSWGEFGFTGEAVAGLANAYTLTATAAYKTAAESGGDYCLYDEGGYNSGTGSYTWGLYAGAAYALTRLSEISGNPASNSWRTAVADDFNERNATSEINWYRSNADDSSSVYDLARLALHEIPPALV